MSHAKVFMMSQNDSRSYPHHNILGDNDERYDAPVSDNSTTISNQLQKFTNLHLSDEMLKIFPGLVEKQIFKLLYPVQEKMKEIWSRIDEKYEKYVMTKELHQTMWKEFEDEYQLYLSRGFGSRKASVSKAMEMLQQSSFGGFIVNSKNEILAVQNYFGSWSAPKGHREIKKNGELEIPWETFLRELFEEISIKYKNENERPITLTKEHISRYITLNQNIYLECYVDIKPSTNDRGRLIRLFFNRIDETNMQFDLVDHKENLNWAWLKIDDILNNKPEPGHDKYYTLRPFVQYFKDHPEHFQKSLII